MTNTLTRLARRVFTGPEIPAPSGHSPLSDLAVADLDAKVAWLNDRSEETAPATRPVTVTRVIILETGAEVVMSTHTYPDKAAALHWVKAIANDFENMPGVKYAETRIRA